MYQKPLYIEKPTDRCFFYHWIDLPKFGEQHGAWDLRGRFADYIGSVDVKGKRVLDVGTASGFLSFAAEEAGAREVVSFDIDTADRQHLLPFAGSEYVVDHASWSKKQTDGFQAWKNAYWLTHRLRGSKAKVCYGDVYNPPEALGAFDVVILGAIIEHLGDPIRALGAMAKHASDVIVVNTDYIDTFEPIARFNGNPDLPDNSYVFWTYSLGTYAKLFEIMGFEVTAFQKNKFHGAKSFTDDKGAMWDRVAIVAKRRKPS